MNNMNRFANQDLTRIEEMIEDCYLRASQAQTRSDRTDYQELMAELQNLYLEREADPVKTNYFRD